MPLPVDGVSAFAILLAEAVLQRAGGGPLRSLAQNLGVARASVGVWESKIDRKWIDTIADDLTLARGGALVVAGRTQPAIVHALTHALNEALLGLGRTVSYRELKGDASASSAAAIRGLCDRMRSGSVKTLVILDANPVYDAPADLGFADLLKNVQHTIHLGDHDETAAAATMHLSGAHTLESWGDVEDFDGTYTVIQPMIAPLWGGHSELEALAAMLGDSADGYEIVQSSFAKRIGVSRTLPGAATIANPAFETAWRRCLHDGVLAGPEGAAGQATPSVRVPRIEPALREAVAAIGPGPSGDTVDVIFAPSPRVHDGRWANNGWLHELPEPVTKNTWDNPLLIGKATADRLGVSTDRHTKGPRYNHVQQCELTIDGRTAVFPVWVQPGLPDNTVVVTLGYGRTRGGRIANGTGVSAYPVRSIGAMQVARGATLTPAKGQSPYLIANTQDHWALEGRDVFREVDLHWWKLHGDVEDAQKDSYGRKRILVGGERLGSIEPHAPAAYDIYKRAPGRGGSLYFHKVDEKGEAILDAEGRKQRPENIRGKPVQQWGMSIDLTTCTGCGACTAACQAENNIPVVGKMEVAKGREMHWIRVDRYFASDGMDEASYANPSVAVQPVPCMQCESAPCEVVCPVNATVHGREGTNDMAYNRCIGTRYCSNNCPYKVRRFNYFDYATKQLDGSFSGRNMLPEEMRDFNTNLVPPRLREKITEVEAMQHNPHVTVRSRGVMEKCTYCMQRINLARVETKIHDLAFIPDGYFQTACQQACPSNSIVFGDIYDYTSNDGKGAEVVAAKNDPRTFAMLAFLNTTPRTTYKVRVRNPNEALRPRGENPFGHHGAGGHHDDHADDHHTDAGPRISLPILTSTLSGALA
jgi:molybdopterin-containing oxidoreductase family iron-sulfur binding subunit